MLRYEKPKVSKTVSNGVKINGKSAFDYIRSSGSMNITSDVIVLSCDTVIKLDHLEARHDG